MELTKKDLDKFLEIKDLTLITTNNNETMNFIELPKGKDERKVFLLNAKNGIIVEGKGEHDCFLWREMSVSKNGYCSQCRRKIPFYKFRLWLLRKLGIKYVNL